MVMRKLITIFVVGLFVLSFFNLPENGKRKGISKVHANPLEDMGIVDIWWTPANPMVGEIVTLYVKAKNFGDIPIPGDAFRIEFWIDEQCVGSIQTYKTWQPGEEETFERDWFFDMDGEHKFSGKINPLNWADENRNNNIITKYIYVSGTTGNILHVGGSGPNNYTTIQSAINAAGDGYTIIVHDDSSPYYENVVIDKEITLLGETLDTIIDGNLDDVITVIANNVTISRLYLRNGDEGIYIKRASNAWVKDCIINNCDGTGIFVYYSNNIHIQGCNVYGNQGDGLSFYYSNNNTISNCYYICSNHEGIELDNSHNNTIQYCTIYQNKELGIDIWQSNGNILLNVTVYSNGDDGIYLGETNNNRIDRCKVYSHDKGNGIILKGSYNELSNSMIYGNHYDNVKISGNNNAILGCSIYDSERGDGVDASSVALQIRYCNIYGNRDYGVRNNILTEEYIINASYNWWGSPDGPSGVGPGSGDAVTQNVIYEPWANESYGKINLLPVAVFRWEPERPKIGELVKFDASRSYDLDGNITGYRWDFDGDWEWDTKWLSTPFIDYSYSSPGTYQVRLQVKDNEGATDIQRQPIEVIPGENQPPTADFTWNPINPKVGERVTFDASCSYDPDGEIILYEWDWDGDGLFDESYEVPTATHLWNNAGSYDVTLRVTDDDGAIDTITKTVTVTSEENQPPVACFTWNPENPKVGERVTFDASCSYDPDGEIVSYSWDLDGEGDIEVSGTTPRCIWTYNEAGSYDVTLRVTDDDGAIDTITKTVTVTSGSYGVSISIPPYGPKKIHAAKEVKVEYLIEIKNLGNTPDTIFLSYNIPNPEWATSIDLEFSNPRLFLLPSESAIVHVYVTAHKAMDDEAEFPIGIEAFSSSDPSKIDTLSLEYSVLGKDVNPLYLKYEFDDEIIFVNLPKYVKYNIKYECYINEVKTILELVIDPISKETNIKEIDIEVRDKFDYTAQLKVEFLGEWKIFATDFDISIDGYCFKNWANINFEIPFSNMRIIWGAYCYGMAETSLLYHNYWRNRNPQEEPPEQIRTYKLGKNAKVVDRIMEHQHRLDQIIRGCALLFANPDEKEEIQKIRSNITENNPCFLCLLSKKGTPFKIGHAVVAYKFIEREDDKYIIFYDNNFPYHADDLYDSLAEPCIYYNETSNTFVGNIVGYEVGKFVVHDAKPLPGWAKSIGDIVLSILCPVNITLVDKYGRKLTDSGICQIPGALFLEINETKWFFIPANLSYKLFVNATNYGNFSFLILLPGIENYTLISFCNVSVSPFTHVFSNISWNTSMRLLIDENGDNIIDRKKDPDKISKIYVGVIPFTRIFLSGFKGYNGWYIGKVKVALVVNETLSGVNATYYRIDDGEWQKYTRPFVIEEDGIHVIEYYSVDNVGNIENIKSVTIKIDKTLPRTEIIVRGNELNGQYIDEIFIGFLGHDSYSGIDKIMYRLDGEKWHEYHAAMRIWREGEHIIEYYAIDRAGNEEQVNSFTFRIDRENPHVAVIYPNGGEIVNDTINIQWNAEDMSNVTISIYYSNDNGTTWHLIATNEENDGLYRWDTIGVEDSIKYKIKIVAEDEVGHVGMDMSDETFIVYNNFIKTKIEQPKAGYLYINSREIVPLLSNITIIIGKINIVAEINCGLPVEKVEFYIDNELKYTAYAEPYIWEWDERAFLMHEIEIVAYDYIGYTDTSRIMVWIFNI